MLTAVASITTWHGWGWSGWTALVALGTIGLAAATFVLAWYSRRDMEAQWRPILIVPEQTVLFLAADTEGQEKLRLRVMNVGRGPALEMGASIVSPKELHITNVPPMQTLPQTPTGSQNRLLEWTFIKPLAPAPPLVKVEVAIAYRDINYRRFSIHVDVAVGPEYGVVSIKQRPGLRAA